MAGPFTITIKDSGGRLDQLLARSLVAGINRTTERAYTASVRAVQKDTGAKSQKSIRKNLFIKKASAKSGGGATEAKVQARSKKEDRIPIYELGPRPRTPGHRPRSPGVSYGPQNELLKGAFIQRMESGHVGVFTRLKGELRKMSRGRYKDEVREPIAEAHGPSVALVFGRSRIQTEIQKVIDERLNTEIDRALAHFGRIDGGS